MQRPMVLLASISWLLTACGPAPDVDLEGPEASTAQIRNGEMTRELAASLIAEQPIAAGKKFALPDTMKGCLRSIGVMIDGLYFGLTEEGQRDFQHVDQLSTPGHFDIIFRKNITFGYAQVDGIRSVSDSQKVIEFRGRPSFDHSTLDYTPCANHLFQQRRTAIAELYDDGWRIRYLKSGQSFR